MTVPTTDLAPGRWPSRRQVRVTTPDGLQVSVREWGRPDGRPIVFVHGLAQSHLSFLPQFASELATHHRLVAYDLRGHGESDQPTDPAYYRDGKRWADELRAVLDALALDRPVLVGWSLGGRVVRTYLIHHGDAGLGGINFVACRPFEDPAVLAPASRADLAGRPESLAARIDAHIAFLRACFHRQPSEGDFAVALAYNAIVPQPIREAIGAWKTGLDETRAALAKVTVPTLVTHGRDDGLILPAAAEMTAAAIMGARVSMYESCGHSPFFEHPARFNRELHGFVTDLKAGHVRERRA